MSKIVFTDPVVAEKYESAFQKDKFVIVPGVYQGMLSNINYAGAYKLVKSGDNQLIEKPLVGVPKVKASKGRSKRTPNI